jgi:hypothetical protein
VTPTVTPRINKNEGVTNYINIVITINNFSIIEVIVVFCVDKRTITDLYVLLNMLKKSKGIPLLIYLFFLYKSLRGYPYSFMHYVIKGRVAPRAKRVQGIYINLRRCMVLCSHDDLIK